MPDRPSDEEFASHPGRLITLGRAMMASGRGDKAVGLVEQVLARNPEDPLLRCCAEAILTHNIPAFHRDMLADAARNRAYYEAIEGAGLVGKSVLDLGAGSGLLAMMAARAGAKRVYACEANEALAATAREIVAANGFADSIRILARHSSTLDAVRDLDGGVDCILSEIFSHELIGEGALPSLADAMARVGRPGARIIPARASIRVALAEYGASRAHGAIVVDGLDLSLFGRHSAHTFTVATDHPRLALRSAAQDLFRFDFQNDRHHPEARAEVPVETSRGAVNGIVQWIRLELDDRVVYENQPGSGWSHWPAVFHPLDEDLGAPDTKVAICGWHDERRLLIWAERDRRETGS
jgi:SAM-dependent methyltransferase